MDLVEALRAHLASKPEVAVAYLFGSRGREEAHENSDIDIAVLFDLNRLPDPVDRGLALAVLAGELDGFHGHWVDVVDFDRCSPPMAFSILSGRQIILDNDRDRRVSAEVRQMSLFQDMSEERQKYLDRLLRGGI